MLTLLEFPKFILERFAKNFKIILDEVLRRLQKDKLIILQGKIFSLTPTGE